jgi:ribosomal protein S18 acetylase RimI-like enzyme
MDIMSKSVGDSTVDRNPEIITNETKDVETWNRAFMAAYFIPSTWEEELLKRESSFVNDPKVKMLIATEKEKKDEAVGCLLLLSNPPECAGIYCVGTVPERRSRGVAKSLMAEAERLAMKERQKLMTLQTIQSDGHTPMYQKFGYGIDYTRDILRI